jgi:cell wall-associated NlpC family hydrolase
MKWISFLLTASTAVGAPMAPDLSDAALVEQISTNTMTISTSATPKQLSSANFLANLPALKAKQTLLEQQAAHAQLVELNNQKMATALERLKKTVGHTWYAFSGASPSGWDCSGLVVWTYEQVGTSLEHRATLQANTGVQTTSPLPGDIVAFTYKGSNSAYHVGIYIGDGKMIHAPKKGHVTAIEDIGTFGGNYSIIEFRRILTRE